MHKELILGFILLLLVATPAFASPGNGNGGKSEEAKDNRGQEVAGQKTAEVPPVTLPTNVPVTMPPIVTQETESLPVESADVTVTLSQAPTKEPKTHEKSNSSDSRQTQGVVVSGEECDPEAEWKNHGEYVSCVAKMHPDGQSVAEAARSDVGKKHQPTTTPSVTPSVTETPTPTPITSPETELGIASSPFEKFLKAISHLLQDLSFLKSNA